MNCSLSVTWRMKWNEKGESQVTQKFSESAFSSAKNSTSTYSLPSSKHADGNSILWTWTWMLISRKRYEGFRVYYCLAVDENLIEHCAPCFESSSISYRGLNNSTMRRRFKSIPWPVSCSLPWLRIMDGGCNGLHVTTYSISNGGNKVTQLNSSGCTYHTSSYNGPRRMVGK